MQKYVFFQTLRQIAPKTSNGSSVIQLKNRLHQTYEIYAQCKVLKIFFNFKKKLNKKQAFIAKKLNILNSKIILQTQNCHLLTFYYQ